MTPAPNSPTVEAGSTLDRARVFDLNMLDEAALRLSRMGAVDLGNLVISAAVIIADLRDDLIKARSPSKAMIEAGTQAIVDERRKGIA